MKKFMPAMSYLPNYSGDIVVAKGNSLGMVIKDKNTDDRRSEVSYYSSVKYGKMDLSK